MDYILLGIFGLLVMNFLCLMELIDILKDLDRIEDKIDGGKK